MLETDETFARWLKALDERHLADLTMSEVARALRALSSCYVERRSRIASGGALDSAGKRAAFALFYAPLHLRVTYEILQAIPRATKDVPDRIVDVGCGTGAAGVAWALASKARRVHGIDRHPWAVAEANWTYRQFSLLGRAVQGDITRHRLERPTGTAFVAAYTVNELTDDARATILEELVAAHAAGARVLIVEPIARRASPWWCAWAERIVSRHGRADEWRFPANLAPLERALARAAGLDPRELTARSLFLG
jgi:SAM-dependent methyltransferase